MARPSAEIIASAELADYTLDVLESERYWVITYQGRPVSLRHRFFTSEGIKMKYPRTGFNNQAHCERLAERLNDHFDTEDFSSHEVTIG